MTHNQDDKSSGSIPLLYRALEDPAFWEPALGALADELRADHVVLDLQADLAPKIVATRVAPNHIAQFSSHDEYRQLRGLVTRATPGGALHADAIISRNLQARSAFYADVIRPMGGHHALLGLTSRTSGTQTALLSVCRSAHKRGFESRQLQQLDAFLPHLETVIRLQRRLARSAVESWWHETALKALPIGIILLDVDGLPCYTNPAADALLAATSAFALSKQYGLSARDPATHRRLREAIRNALGNTDDAVPVALRLHSGQPQNDVWLRVAPLAIDGAAVETWSPARVLIFCDGPERQVLDKAELAQTFGFSPREIALAQALMNGQTLSSAADTLGVSHETVRSQLKSLFTKTDTNRQAELTTVLNKLRRWSGH